MAREIRAQRDEKAHPDIMEKFSTWWRRKPWVAWPVIIVTVLVALYGVVELVLRVVAAFRHSGPATPAG